jgi:predicted kinase
MPIGPSGCGKSTLYHKLRGVQRELHNLSKDSIRCLLYGDDYAKAWIAANNDKDFVAKVKVIYEKMLGEKSKIYLDNTNLSPKIRRYWLTEASKYNYTKIAIVFDVDVDILLSRQVTREDKTVPKSAIYQQVAALKQPVIGEFDVVYSIIDVIRVLENVNT